MKTNFIISAILLLIFSPLKAQIVINEVMQSNIDCLKDDRNEFPDSWVELYNMSSSVYTLNQFKIGETRDPSKAWQLPTRNLEPHSFVVILCDNEADGLHTDFRLDSGKGASIYLFHGDEIVDSLVDLAKQPSPNISYGRLNETSSVWGYQLKPTPNTSNCGTLSKGTLGEPVFSIEGCVFEKSPNEQLTLTLPEGSPAGTVIRYTTDGSEPTSESKLYSKPLLILSTTIIRAKLFCEGYTSPRSTTHSYLALGRDMTLPVISISTDDKYFRDSKFGIYVEGSYKSGKKNWEYNWRRPIHFEFFDAPGTQSKLNQLCETRISGAASRGCKYKSLAIYAHKRFGTKRFKYEFFPDQRPEQTNYKSLVLRNAGNDFDYLYMRDAIAQLTFARNTDLDYQAWQPAIIYINGKYSGILNIRERGNDDNIFTNYDELEDIDVFENWTSLKKGTKDNLDAFKAFYNEHGHTWDEYSQWMDLDEFINLFLMNSYFNNVDFPANNIMMWRPREEGGRWRFIAKDVDYIMGIYNQNSNTYQYFSWLNNNNFDGSCNWANTADGTRLFRRLMEDKEFKLKFTDRLAIYMGDFLNYDRIWTDIWQPMYETIEAEYPHHRKLINEWWPKYSDEISSAQRWLKGRTDFMYKHVNDYYKTGTPVTLTICNGNSDADLAGQNVTFNGIRLSKSKFKGKYYQGREVTLGACSDADAKRSIIGWSITTVGTNGSVTTVTTDTPNHTFTMPQGSQVLIAPKIGSYNDIDTPQLAASDAESEEILCIYDSRGIRHNTLQPGINIIHYKDGHTKKIIHE